MKKLLLTSVATLLITTSGNSVANADEFSGKTNIWAWGINVPPLQAAAKLFTKAHPNAHIKISSMGQATILQKLSAGLISHGKGLPNATLMSDSLFNSYINIYPSSFVNVGKMGFDKLVNLFPAYKTDAVKYKSHMYGFPFDAGPAVIFYRRSVFAKAGVKPTDIKTWDDFFKYGKIIKAKTGKYMFSVSDYDAQYRIMMGQYGKSYYDSKGNIDLNSPQSIKALKFIQSMYKAGILHHISAGWTPLMRDIASNTVSAIPEGIWLAGNIEKVAPKTKGDWGVIPLPVNGDGDVNASPQGGSGFVMLKYSKNQKLTYNFLKYYTTTTEAQSLAFNGGLFPSLTTMYNTKDFKAKIPFFKNQQIWVKAAQTITSIKPFNFTQDFYYAKLEVAKMFSGIIANGDNVVKRVNQATNTLKARTGRKVN